MEGRNPPSFVSNSPQKPRLNREKNSYISSSENMFALDTFSICHVFTLLSIGHMTNGDRAISTEWALSLKDSL